MPLITFSPHHLRRVYRRLVAKAGIPIRTPRPPGATASITCNAVFSLPIVSNPVSKPRPSVICRGRSTTSLGSSKVAEGWKCWILLDCVPDLF